MKKRGFTILELLFVVLIISVLFTAFGTLFQNDNKDFIQAQSCANYAFGSIKSILMKASTGKGFYSGDVDKIVNPDIYSININPSAEKLVLAYSGVDSGSGVYQTYYFSGAGDNKYGCYGSDYTISLTGDNYDIKIRKLMEGTVNQPAFLINDDWAKFTGEVSLNFCGTDTDSGGNNFCRPIGVFIIDKRINNIRFNRCINWGEGGKTCVRRSEN